jgi:hypothetical protein
MAEVWLADGDMASSVWIAPTAPSAGRFTMAKPPNSTLICQWMPTPPRRPGRRDVASYVSTGRNAIEQLKRVLNERRRFFKLLDYEITQLQNSNQEKVGSLTKSFLGTDSSGFPALSQALSPPTMTNALNPLSRSRCATRALVASRVQVQ